MKLNSSQSYLELLLHALETQIKPELKSASAQGIAEMMRTTLVELCKRQGPSIAVLRECAAEGEALAGELRAFLKLADAPSVTAAPDVDSFELQAARHQAVTAVLAELCSTLAASGQPGGEALLRRIAEWEMRFYIRQAQLTCTPPSAPENAGSPLSRESLQQFLNDHRSEGEGATEVTAFQPVLGGFGKQTFLCRLRDAMTASERDLVVRKTDPVPIMMHGFCVIEQEYDLLRSLAKTGYPAPRPQLLGSKVPGIDGSFYTMDRIAGKVPGSFLGGLAQPLDEGLFLHLAELLARLHTTPLETFSDYLEAHGEQVIVHGTAGDCYRRNLAGWKQYAARTEHLPSPYLSWLFDWLERNVPDDRRRPVLVHGDFNIHNVLAENGRITGVLDWECADFGAPEQDLAYIQPHISKHIDWQRFVDHYVRCGGAAPDPARYGFCMAYAALRTNLAGNRGTYNLQRGANRDIRYVMIELGFTPAFMQLALGSTLGEAQDRRVE